MRGTGQKMFLQVHYKVTQTTALSARAQGGELLLDIDQARDNWNNTSSWEHSRVMITWPSKKVK